MDKALISVLVFLTPMDSTQTFTGAIKTLIMSSCIDCHDGSTKTQLDLRQLGDDLTEPETFRQWEKVYDRMQRGDMPPKSEPRTDEALRQLALVSQWRWGVTHTGKSTGLEVIEVELIPPKRKVPETK